ncbi:MAG: hypothetical protein ACLVGG_01330 [Bacteroides nordii]
MIHLNDWKEYILSDTAHGEFFNSSLGLLCGNDSSYMPMRKPIGRWLGYFVERRKPSESEAEVMIA